MEADPHDLSRFVQAQAADYARALDEIRSGRKRSHWMWYIFPQFAGLGSSPTSRRYAIKSLAEAEAYLRHPVLGPRLRACAEAVLAVEGRSASEIFGTPDDMKLRSSATLLIAYRLDVELNPSPSNCGKMYHIQCDCFRPLLISASACP